MRAKLAIVLLETRCIIRTIMQGSDQPEKLKENPVETSDKEKEFKAALDVVEQKVRELIEQDLSIDEFEARLRPLNEEMEAIFKRRRDLYGIR